MIVFNKKKALCENFQDLQVHYETFVKFRSEFFLLKENSAHYSHG